MKTAAVICEYNPFHNGHRDQCLRLKDDGFGSIVSIMGGVFSQRGEPYVFDKLTRAETAVISSPIDIVTELPYPYSCASADRFAEAGVFIADRLGICTHLAFGCETENTGILYRIAEFMLTDEYRKALETRLEEKKHGPESQVQTSESVISEKFGKDAAEEIKKRNNILAVEYIKAIMKTGSCLIPYPILRSDCTVAGNCKLATASEIREMILSKNGFYNNYIPDEASLKLSRDNPEIHNIEYASREIAYTLLKARCGTGGERSDPDGYYECSGGIGRAILKACGNKTVSEITGAVTTKKYPRSKTRRALISMLNGTMTSDLDRAPSASLILAIARSGRDLLRDTDCRDDFRLVSTYAGLSEQLDARSLDLYNSAELLYGRCTASGNASSFTRPFIL